jgi:hypothetical protein
MSNGNGHRWSKFWWRDHQGDAALRACSLAARGYWLELLCVAHEANPVGHVLINGRKPNGRQMAVIAGCTEREAKKYEAELEEAGVFSRAFDGTIYCRRMVRDAEVSEQGKAWGKTGGNPTLKPKPNGSNPTPPLTGGDNPPLKAKVNGRDNPGAYRSPQPPPLSEGVKLEADTDSEVEAEERKEDFENYLLSLRSSARGVEAPVAQRLAVENVVGKLGRALKTTADRPMGKVAKLSVSEQIREAIRGPVIEDDYPGECVVPIRRPPVDPVRSPDEQVAEAMGITLEEATALLAKNRAAFRGAA